MIIFETFEENGQRFVRSYSDSGMMIHGGSPEGDYVDACDPASFGRTYTETGIPVVPDELDAETILNILMGVSE